MTASLTGFDKGMVVLSEEIRNPPVCRTFEAKLFILYHEGSVRNGFQATVHVKGVMQTATVVSMGEQEVREFVHLATSPPLSECCPGAVHW